MDPTALADACSATARSARDALAWVGDPLNAAKVALERPALEGKLRRVAAEADRLARSAARPTCVGVFGPSQAGKSYLVSILARRDHEPLIATFAGDRPEIDFIRDINPIGGDESTGVVTRFTVKPQAAPAGYPVCLRLLGETDIVKILVNSFFQDGDQEYEGVPDPAALDGHFSALEARRAAAPTGPLTEADLWDVQDYVGRNAGGAATAVALAPFWGRIAALVPRLGVEDRGEALSVLWGRHATYTGIYRRLVGALAALGFAEDAFCRVDALTPSRDSIINVNALDGLAAEGGTALPVAAADGRVVDLPRPVVTALVAELRIVCRDRPLPFFDHTDLLDFPGYRSRTRYDLRKFLREDKAPREVFLRGKVDYLFQRYTGELELTTMVLCVPDSTLEVTSLPKAVETWVGLTHGATPEKRVGKPNLLFFALTKFDRTLERKAGDDQAKTLSEKFEVRFGASLGPFGKIEPSWVGQWTPGTPFRNLFLIRNPNVQFKGVVVYEGSRETGIAPAEASWIASLRGAFVALPVARRHFADPGAAWDALMGLNDGGAGRLAAALGAVCDPALKLGQVGARLSEIRVDVLDLLGRHHVSEDVETRRAERLAIVDERIFPALNGCAERGTFGSALRGLMVDASDLHAVLSETLNHPEPEPRPAEDAPAPRAAVPSGPFGRRPAAPDAAAAPTPAPPAPSRPDRAMRLAGAALSRWASLAHARVDDLAFVRRIGLGRAGLKEIVAELGEAARRLDLAARIRAELKARAGANESNDVVARRAAGIAERMINRFVSELDFDRIAATAQMERFRGDLDAPVFAARPVAFDASGIGAERRPFDLGFMEQWGSAFRATVSQNAGSKTGSREDAAQNARLGRILAVLGA